MDRCLPLLLLAAAACQAEATPTHPKPPIAAGPSAVVEEVTRPRRLELVGTLRARREVVLSSPVGGRVEAVLVQRGQVVREGELLVQLTAEEQAQAAQAADFSVQQARARMAGADDAAQTPEARAAQHTLSVAADAARRAERLHLAGSASDQELLKAREDEALARAQLASALAQAQSAFGAVEQLRASARQSRAVLADKRVRAPFAGLVLERLAEPGEVVAAGAPLVSLIDLGGLRVRFEAGQADARQLRLQQAVAVELEGEVHRATVTTLAPGLVGEGRLRQGEATLEAPEPSWLPGAFVRLAVELPQQERALRLPRSATRVVAGVTRAFVKSGARAEERLLTVLRPEGADLLVATGVEPGERVFTEPPPSLRDGDEVEP